MASQDQSVHEFLKIQPQTLGSTNSAMRVQEPAACSWILTEQFGQMRFYSVTPEVDVKSTFTRKTESGHHAESLSGGCNVPPAGRSAQQEIIELKNSVGTLSSDDNPSQMGQKGYLENGVMC
jgi:hypothetical protein